MPTQLLAGAAKAVITPPVGVDLSGFGGRSGPAQGVHDDLHAAALYLEAEQSALLMTADLIGLDSDSVAEVRQRIADRTEVPGESVMITCSHTHSGPATPCLPYLGQPDPDYMEHLKRQLAHVAAEAWQHRAPASWGAAREQALVGINRRELKQGAIVLGRNQAGTTAPYVDVLRVDDESGSPIAVWMCHPAHAVTLGGDNLLISADWPGYARRAVERLLPGSVALFAQGCCGNINSDPRGTFDMAREQGERLAHAVEQATQAAETEPNAEIAVAHEVLQLPLFDPPSPQEAAAALEQLRRDRQAKWEESNYGWRILLDGLVAWGEEILRLAQAGARDMTRDFEVQAVRIGDFGIVGLPGEVFVEYALQIDRDSPCRLTPVPAYTNGNVGYVPVADAYPQGGYEVDTAIRYYGTTMLRPQSEQMILGSANRLLRQLWSLAA
jgi:neutral ceramidase